MMRLVAPLLALVLLALPVNGQAAPYPDYDSVYVNDYVGLLTTQEAAQLEDMLRGVRDDHGIEITVAIIRSRDDWDSSSSLETFATRMFNGWGVGNSARNDGVMFLIITDDRDMRLELGSGYVTAWNDQAASIVQSIMVPNFKKGEMALGVRAGVGTMIARIGNNIAEGRAATDSPYGDSWQETQSDYGGGDGGGGWIGWILGALGLPIAGGGAWAARRYVRYKPRSCGKCSTKMGLIDEESDDAYLIDGARMEEELKSVDHDVWQCPSCDHFHIESWRNWFSSYGTCKSCGFRALDSDRTVLQSATYSSSGLARIDYNCLECGHAYSKVVTIPRKTKSSSSSGGSSFGGGSSSGGGASGSW